MGHSFSYPCNYAVSTTPVTEACACPSCSPNQREESYERDQASVNEAAAKDNQRCCGEGLFQLFQCFPPILGRYCSGSLEA